MGDLSQSGEALFGTLIADKDSTFSASPRPSTHCPYFYPKFGQSSDAIGSGKWGHFGDTWVARDFPKIFGKIMGNLSPSGETLFGTPIAAKDSPFPASFRPPRRGPYFYPRFGQFPDVISSRKRAISETHGLPVIFLKFRKIMGNPHPLGGPISNPNRG